MRLTQGALGMLLKKYRKILKKCFWLNLMGGVIMTGALAGIAQAEPDWSEDAVITITGNQTLTEPQSANTVTMSDGATLNVTIPAEKNDFKYLRIFDSMSLVPNSSINVKGGYGIQGGALELEDAPFTGIFEMSGGSLNVQNSAARFAGVNIADGQISIEGARFGETLNDWRDASTLAAVPDPANMDTSGIMNISGKNTVVNIGDAGMLAAARMNISEATLNMGGNNPQTAAFLRGIQGDGNAITMESGAINIAKNKYAALGAPMFDMKGGAINVEGSLTLGGGLAEGQASGTIDEALGANVQHGQTQIGGGTINVAKGGELAIAPNCDFTMTGGSLHNAGLIRNNSWFATIESSNIYFGSLIDMTGGAFTAEPDSRLEVEGSLKLTDKQLQEALKGALVIRGGEVYARGEINNPESLITDGPAANGKISFDDVSRVARLGANTLNLSASSIELPHLVHLYGDKVNFKNSATLASSGLAISGKGGDSSLNIADGKGTLTLTNSSTLYLGESHPLAEGESGDINIFGRVVIDDYSYMFLSEDVIAHNDIDLKKDGTLGIYPSSLTMDGANGAVTLRVSENGMLYITDSFGGSHAERPTLDVSGPNAFLVAEQGTTLINGGILKASADSLGLERKGDVWTSKNLGESFTGSGRFNITGIGGSLSEKSFASLRDILGAGILKVDASIEGAVANGQVSLDKVAPGAILAGADLGDAIASGQGNAGNANYLSGAFGGVNLTAKDSTGITVSGKDSRDNPLELNGVSAAASNGGNLVNTPGGAGDVVIEDSTHTFFANGAIRNLEMKSNSGTCLDNVDSKAIIFNTDDQYSFGATLNIQGKVTADKIEVVNGASPMEDKDFVASGYLSVWGAGKLTVQNAIGDPKHLLGDLYINGGEVSAKSIDVFSFTGNGGMVRVEEGIHAVNMFSVDGTSIITGDDVVMDAINISDGGEISSSKGSVTAGNITATDGNVVAATDVVIQGQTNLNNGTVTAQNGSVTIDRETVLAGESSITAAKNITLRDAVGINGGQASIQSSGGDISFAKDVKLNSGELRIAAGEGTVNGAGIAATSITAQAINASGEVNVAEGELELTGDKASEVGGDLNLVYSKSDVRYLNVKGQLLVDKGELSSSGAINLSENATFSNGAKVNLNTLTMTEGKTLTVGHGDETIGGATVSVSNLRLNGADLLVDPAWGQPASQVAVGGFGNNDTARDTVLDGNVAVGQNSMVTFGTTNQQWLPGVMANDLGINSLSATGVSAALGLFSPIRLGNGHSLTVNGAWTSGQPYNRNNASIQFGGNSLLVVNGQPAGATISYATGQNRPASVVGAISAEKSTQATVEAGAKLHITGAEANKTYVILDPQTIQTTYGDSDTSWSGDNLTSDNPLVALKRADLKDGSAGEIIGERKDASSELPGIDDGPANSIDDSVNSGAIGTSPSQLLYGPGGTRFLSNALVMASPDYGKDPGGAAATIEGAARMVTVGAAPQMTLAASKAAGAAVSQRASIANPGSGIQSMDENGNVLPDQNQNKKGFSLWILPLYQSSNGFGMEAGNFDYNFSGALGGVAIGADYTFANAIRAGLLFNIGGGFARGSGDFNATDNNMNFWGVGAYVGWNRNNFGLTADFNFTSTYNKLKQDLDGMGAMNELKADVQGWAINTGLTAEYKLNTDAVDIIPHVGARFINLNMDSYDINHNGTVLDGDSMTQNIWTFPLGITFSKQFTLDKGWSIKPFVDLNVTPVAGDVKAKSTLRFTGTSQDFEVKTQMMDYTTYGGTAGVEFGNDNFKLSVNYNGQFGAKTSAHGVFGMLRYEF